MDSGNGALAAAIVRVADLAELDKITGHLDAAKEKVSAGEHPPQGPARFPC